MIPYDIVTIDGDGIGPEVFRSAEAVLHEACGSRLCFRPADGGASHYLKTGAVLPDSRARTARRPTSPGRTWPARWPPSGGAR